MIMSAPTPIEESLACNKKTKEFNLSLDNKQYIVQMILSDEIKINLLEKDNISAINLNINLTLKELGQYNKIFKMYETIDESYDSIEKLFLKGKVAIKQNDNKLFLVLKMNSPFGDEEEIVLPLEEKQMDKSQINDILINETNQLKKRITILEEENISFKNIIKNMETKILELENKIKLLEKPETILDSKIISKNEEIDFVINRLKQALNNKTFNFNLLYRATKDGDALSVFHSKCDFKTKVLVLYHTIKGVRFGGYTEIGFDSSGDFRDDLNCFLFSINKKTIYKAKNHQQIFCHKGNGPCFGNSVIYLYDDVAILSKNKKKHKTCTSTESFEGLNGYEINNGEQYFNLQELEVYQIVFN